MPSIRTFARPLAIALPLAFASTAAVFAAEPAAPTAKTTAAPADAAAGEPNLGKVASDDAIELDVLAVVSLPIAADEAREAGVPPDEVAGVITAVVDVGASPAVATDLLVAEAEQTKKRGAKPHFAAWTRGQLAEGKASETLVADIEKAEAQYIELSADERAKLDANITKMHDQAVEQRKAQWLRVSELRKQGKQLRIAGQAKLADLRKRVEASAARLKRIEDAKADPKKKEALEHLVARVEKVVEKAVDKAVDKADAAVDKAEKVVEKAVDKAEKEQAKAEKKAAHAEHAADKKAAEPKGKPQ